MQSPFLRNELCILCSTPAIGKCCKIGSYCSVYCQSKDIKHICGQVEDDYLLNLVISNDLGNIKDFFNSKPISYFKLDVLKKIVKYCKDNNMYEVLAIFRERIVDYYSPEFLISCSNILFDMIKSSNILKKEKQAQRVASLVVLENNDIFSAVNQTAICAEQKILQMKFNHPVVVLMVNRFTANNKPAVSRPCEICVPIIKEANPLFVCYFTKIYEEDGVNVKSIEVQFELACTLNVDGLRKDKNSYPVRELRINL